MRTLQDHLSNYAAYHRDRRNIATHFVGIPMIMAASAALLSRPVFAHLGAVPVSPALLVAALSTLFYLSLDLGYGLVMAAVMALNTWAGAAIAQQSTTFWLAAGIGGFVIGWII